MPAAAVIPAPIAYIKVVAVKTLVVGFATMENGPSKERSLFILVLILFSLALGALYRVLRVAGKFTLKKLECLKQAI